MGGTNAWTLIGGSIALLAVATPAQGQSEGHLRNYFEGRSVVILLDMPADEDGINVRVDSGRSIDRRDVSKNLDRYGAALRTGDPAQITLVKVKGKHIEFQLDGGGWQGGHRASLGYAPAPKSERHLDIEAELALLPDPSDRSIPDEQKQLRLRRILEEDLEQLIFEYDELNAAGLAEAEDLQAHAQQDLDRRIQAAGSRFNLRYDRRVPAEALTPEGLKLALKKYVAFSPEGR
jgi:hypothetical protein